MSAHKGKSSKRALPNVPLARTGSVDFINPASLKSTNLQKISAGSNARIPSRDTSSVSTTPEKVLLRKSSAPAGVLRSQLLKSSPLSLRKRLLQERRDSENSTSSDSPLSSRRGSKENEPVVMGFEGISKEDGVHKANDRKIARVLPMSPASLTETNEVVCSTTFTKNNFKKLKQLEKPLRNGSKKEYHNTPDCSKPQLGTPKSLDVKSVPSTPHTPYQVPNITDEDSCSITVAVRVRPLLQREKSDPRVKICVSMNNNETRITSDKGIKHDFLYDYSLWSVDPKHPDFVDQEKLYKLLGEPLLSSAFQGYNTCLFAYGQTGSGKSYSIMGQGKDIGVLPRFCEELFERIHIWPECKFTVEISYFEIYNEKIHDLLVSNKGKDKETKKQLRVREHPVLGPFVQDLSTYVVSTYSDIESWLALGNRNRATAATGMNDKSSRSHSVFTIMMTQTKTEVFEDTEAQLTTTSKINLIDLAGSERASNVLNEQVINSTETTNLRLKEGGSINKSLHTLGKVISLLSDKELQKKKKMYIPYRDSILTWLLKDSLGGNSKTAMIANISPASSQFGETLSTLRYAQRARTIINKAVINEDPNAKIIRELRAEIEQLHKMHASNSPEDNKNALAEIQLLREKLMESQRLLVESTRNWQEKFALSERRKREEAENLKKAGISFKVDNRLPNLVNLNEDPQLSEMLLYILKPGISTVGHREEEDIQLSGALVAESHCIIKNDGESVTVTPIADAPTYVNGQLINEETELHHGDRLVIGGDHFFRLNHPIESKKRKEQLRSGLTEGANQDGAVVKDFEFARNELAQVQNARLQAELEEAREEARLQAQEEIMKQIQKEKEAAAAELMRQKSEYEMRNEELQQKMDILNRKKEDAERSNQSKEDVISELQAHRQMLEQEILSNRKKLQMEAIAAKQALEETKLNQIRIMSELEKEKKKMQEDVSKLKEAKKQREIMREEFRASFNALGRKASTMDDPSKKELLRITMALREANKISQHMKKNITFSRDEVIVDGKSETKVRLNDTKKGLTTLWTIEKFESRLDLMRDLYQQDEGNYQGDDDPFHDPADQWDKDFKLNSPHNRRISTMGALSLASRKTAADTVDNKARAESIFAKYRNKQESSTSSIPENLDMSNNNLPSPTPEGPVFDSPTSSSPLLSRKVEQSTTSSRIQSRGSSCDSNHVRMVSLVCAHVLGKSLSSLQENPEGLRDPTHEKVLSSVQRIKASLSNIKKHCKATNGSENGEEKSTQENCVLLTVCMETLIAHVQSWECSYHGNNYKKFTSLRGTLVELIQDLSSVLVKLLSTLGESSTHHPNLDESFTESESLLKEIVKQTAKMAVFTMDDSLNTEKKYSECGDGDLEEAFLAGQEQFVQSSIRQSLDTLDSIQEQIDENIIRVDVSEVEKEVTEEVVTLLRATSDFIHQGREIQFQLQSAMKNISQQRRSNGRFPFAVRLVRGLDTILDLTKALATTTPQACDDMDLNSIIAYPEKIASATETITRSCRAYIDSEFSCIGKEHREEISDEQDYFEKKAEDVHTAALGLKNILKHFMFLKPFTSKSGPRADPWRTPFSTYNAKRSLKDDEITPLRRYFSKESPI